MKIAKLRMVRLSVALLALSTTTSAFAQDTTVDQAPPPAQTQVGMGLPGAAPQTTATGAPAAGGTDHSLVVGHLGFGYLGRPGVAVGTNGPGSGVVAAPVIGVRYWFDPGMGLDVGLGLGINSGSNDPAGDPPSAWAFVLHGGLPLALASGRHYTFEIVPEANIGLGGGSGGGVTNKGFLLDLGARAGAEIQFGFIGIPELALQGSIGASLSITSQSSTPDNGPKNSASQTSFSTTVYNSPWGIFTNSVSALYYF